MVYPEVRKFLAYAGLAMVLAPAFAPIVQKIAKGIYACINESREEIIFNSPLQEEDIYLNGGRSIMDIISAEEDDSIKMRAITISFPKESLLSDDREKTESFKKGLKDFVYRTLDSMKFSIYVIIKIDIPSNDEQRLFDLMEELNLFRNGFEKYKVLLCETDAGKVHIIRHIHPDIHIDYCMETSKQLLPHLLRVYLVGESSVTGDVSRDTPPGLNKVNEILDIVV